MDSVPASSNDIVTQKGDQNDTPLSEYSPKDKPWDTHRAQADKIEAIYRRYPEFRKHARRIAECAMWLLYAWVNLDDESVFKLRKAKFCRVRTCPVCQWRRCLMWLARFFQALPGIVEQYPKSRWVFLTLTVRNPEVENLGETLQDMNKAWNRLRGRKEFRVVQGWLRSTEVTRNEKYGTAHPHFHCLLMVPPSYFTHNYIKHDRWVELWQSCLKVGYPPDVDIRAVKTPTDDPEAAAKALTKGVTETLKYSIKPSDMVKDEEWFIEFSRQIHRKRFLATGGALKDILKQDQESDDDLALKNDDEDEGETDPDESWKGFAYSRPDQFYRRRPELDVQPD